MTLAIISWVQHDVICTDQIPVIVIGFIVEIFALFSIENIFFIKANNSPKVMWQKYQLHSFFASIDNFDEFERFCINESNKDIIESIFFCFPDLSYEEVQKMVETKDLSKIKQHINPNTRRKRKETNQIHNALFWYNSPKHFLSISEYKSSQLLVKKSSVGETVLASVSVVLSLVSFAGLTSFFNMHWIVYLQLSFPIIIYIVFFYVFYKYTQTVLLECHENCINEIKKTYSKYLSSKQSA